MSIKISASLVKDLRALTGASIADCREALAEAKGNVEKAVEYLRERGKEIAQKKSGRETGEGVVASYIHSNKKIGAIVELRCDTDFVAKNSEFQELAYDLAMHIAAMAPKYISPKEASEEENPEEVCLLAQKFIKDPNLAVADLIQEKISKIGENIRVEKFERFEI